MIALLSWLRHRRRHERPVYVTVDHRAGVQLYWMQTTENTQTKEQKP